MIEECVCRVQQQQIVKHLHTVRTYRYCSYPGVVCEESSKPTQGALCATNCAGAEFRGRFGQQQCSDEKWSVYLNVYTVFAVIYFSFALNYPIKWLSFISWCKKFVSFWLLKGHWEGPYVLKIISEAMECYLFTADSGWIVRHCSVVSKMQI